ncbi:hypothetical protein V8E54_009566 [Elaphomyces granulatus]
MDDMAKATQEQSAISPGSDVSAHATDIERIYVKSLALCREEWPQSKYTSIVMVDFILKLIGKSWEQFIETPSFKADKEEIERRIMDALEESLRPLWNEGTGLCTSSWSINIMHKLLTSSNLDTTSSSYRIESSRTQGFFDSVESNRTK